MVFITSLLGAATLLSGFANALPRPMPDSAIGGEVAVSAPNGVIMSDTAELYSQLATPAGSQASSAPYAAATPPPSYGSDSYGSSGSYNSGSYGSPPPAMGQYGGNQYGGGQYGGNQYGGNQYSSSSLSSSSSSSSWMSSSTSYAPPAYTSSSTSTSMSSYSTPSYGSGGSNWGNQGYDNCVQQCLASYSGLPPAMYTATATNTPSYGTGATHTVIVAPTQGVLRYVPFAVNASVGDTIKFMWGANNHTVTKSSELLPCNKTSDALFVSGTQNKGFVFTQVVNDTNPTFFYCATPTHCQKGMFGIINPPSALGAPTSVGQMMTGIAANNSDVAAYATYTSNQTASQPQAAGWGNSIDMASVPDWAQQYVAENVMYTRLFLGANPELMKGDGSVDLSSGDSTPLVIPQDFSVALAATSPTTGSAAGSSPAASVPADSTPSTASSGTPEGAAKTGSASTISSSKVLTALALSVVGFLTL